MFGAICCMCIQIDNSGRRVGNSEEMEFWKFLFVCFTYFPWVQPFSHFSVTGWHGGTCTIPCLRCLAYTVLNYLPFFFFFPIFSLLSLCLLCSLARAGLSPQSCLSLNSMEKAWRLRNVSLVQKVLCVGHWCCCGGGGEGE